jgi:hypothetical protein
MGIILHDAIEVTDGIELSNLYMNIQRIQIIKPRDPPNPDTGEYDSSKYIVSTMTNRYVSLEARTKNKVLDQVHLSFDIETLPSDITELYTKSYEIMKTMSSTWDDVIN